MEWERRIISERYNADTCKLFTSLSVNYIIIISVYHSNAKTCILDDTSHLLNSAVLYYF